MEHLESSEQAAQLREIGAKLSQERQARSVPLEEIAAKTYIPLRLLSAIDAGRLDLLPEPVFIQGFIRRYADFLGLDGTTLSQGFSIEQQPPPPKLTLMEAPQHAPVETVEPDPVRQPLDRRYLVFGAIGLGVLGLIAIILANRPKAVEPPKSSQRPVGSALLPNQTVKPQASVSPRANSSGNPSVAVAPSPIQAVAPSPMSTATGAVEVKVNLIDESWVEVRVDGQVAYEGTLPKGTQRSWAGKQEIVITSGNAGAVNASYNNTAAKPLGALGMVTSVSFPPTGSATGNLEDKQTIRRF